MAYKVIRKTKFEVSDILLLFANSFIFYGIGYAILNENETGRHLLGVFTVFNGLIHFVVSAVIFRYKLVDKKYGKHAEDINQIVNQISKEDYEVLLARNKCNSFNTFHETIFVPT